MAKRKASDGHDHRAPKAARNTQLDDDALNDIEQTSSPSNESHGADEVESSAESPSPAANSQRAGSKSSNHTEDGQGLQFLSLLTEACEQRRKIRESRLSDLDEDDGPFIPNSERAKVFEKLQQSGKRRLQMMMRKLSDANETGLAGEQVLTMLPVGWFTQLSSLRRYSIFSIQNTETELALLASQLEEAYTTLSEQVAQRCRGLEDLSEKSTEEGDLRSLHLGIMETNRNIQRYYLRQVSLQDRLDVHFSELWEKGEHLLEVADRELIAAGFLTAPERERNQEGLPHGSDREGKGSSASQLDNGASQPHLHNQASNNHAQYENTEDLLAILQNESSRDLTEAKRALSQASRAFHNVRETYRRRYEMFQNEIKAGRFRGTKTLFDGDYFLERNRLNHKLTVAEEEWSLTRKNAQRTGALPRALHTSDFADRSDDGHTPQEVEAYIASFDMDLIERWRSDGAQRDIEQDESKWEAGVPDYEAEFASVAALSSTSQDRYDTSRRRKLIARWHKEQEDIRKVEQRRWRKAMKG
ncbi:hypothetical protein KC333_g6157 [Hortaea werneckii]|nr:hypothetical protein KC333_g6157 [Hortaea werneckii]KAI7311933.1 hypothetical protein KC326_g6061 [Hortaea werneckii]